MRRCLLNGSLVVWPLGRLNSNSTLRHTLFKVIRNKVYVDFSFLDSTSHRPQTWHRSFTEVIHSRSPTKSFSMTLARLQECRLQLSLASNSPKAIRYGVVANISRSHNLRDQYRGAQGSIPCTGVSLLLFLTTGNAFLLFVLLCSLYVPWRVLTFAKSGRLTRLR